MPKSFSNVIDAIAANQTDMMQLIQNWAALLDPVPQDVTFTMFDGTVYVIPNFAKTRSATSSDEISNESTVSGSTVTDALSDLNTDVTYNSSEIVTLNSNLSSEIASRAAEDANLQSQITSITDELDSETETYAGTFKVYGYASDQDCPYGAKIVKYRGTITMEVVHLLVTGVSGALVGTTVGIQATSIPAALRPSDDTLGTIQCYNSLSFPIPSSILISSISSMGWAFYPPGGFTPGATSVGIPRQLITYVKSWS